jgi:hypothetical protein
MLSRAFIRHCPILYGSVSIAIVHPLKRRDTIRFTESFKPLVLALSINTECVLDFKRFYEVWHDPP